MSPRTDDSLLPELESTDDLLLSGLKVIQAIDGYRFSIDPVLLTGFVGDRSHSRIVDIGTGNGVIPLLLVAHNKADSVLGLELQPQMVQRARRSVALNHLTERIKIVEADLRNLSEELTLEPFDAVTANPPFRQRETGRLAPNDERARARHEVCGGLNDFLQSAAALLKGAGHFYVIYLAERLVELLSSMHYAKLEPKRLKMVHSRQGEKANMVLVEGVKNGRPGLKIESPLIIYKGAGRDYTDEVLAMYGLNGTSDLERGT